MKKVLLAVALAALVACGDEILILPTAPIPEGAVISGGWRSIVSSSSLPDAVWTMTLSQERSVAVGTWADDENDFVGTVTVNVFTNNEILGDMSIKTKASCTLSFVSCGSCTSVAVVRGILKPNGTMEWDTIGWPNCADAPGQVKMEWLSTR